MSKQNWKEFSEPIILFMFIFIIIATPIGISIFIEHHDYNYDCLKQKADLACEEFSKNNYSSWEVISFSSSGIDCAGKNGTERTGFISIDNKIYFTSKELKECKK